jgi:hypothetical protein
MEFNSFVTQSLYFKEIYQVDLYEDQTISINHLHDGIFQKLIRCYTLICL